MDPFADDKVQELLRSLSNHNLRSALKFATTCIHSARRAGVGARRVYNLEAALRVLYGRSSTSKDGDPRVEDTRALPNILRALSPGDPVPLLYVTLVAVRSPVDIDESYFELVNSIAREINPIELSEPKLGSDKIMESLVLCHKFYLIHRSRHVDFGDLPEREEIYAPDQRLRGHEVCLTEKGAYLLSLAKDATYQELTTLNTWRAQVADYIKKRTHRVIKPDAEPFVDDKKGNVPYA